MFKAKVLVLGPCESGKTVISNFLSDATEISNNDYHPTQGCRILEFEVNNVNVSGKFVNADIELWDCGGDHKFESCWPAIAKDTNGVVFVINPEQANQDRELESFYNYFVEQHALRESQCVIFAHHKNPDGNNTEPSLPSCFNKINWIHTSLEDDGENLREDFSRFVGSMLTAMSDTKEQEELRILNS